jgi:phosphoribosylamine--glycine ligase
MKILVIGSGGREHALVWKLSQSRHAPEIFCAPGNAGTAERATNVPIKAGEIDALAAFAQRERIDLTIVGSEEPLTLGIVDRFTSLDLKIFGPTAAAAEIESSKIFAKRLMKKYGVPTAAFGDFDDAEAASAFIRRHDRPMVIKADGLAAGKGVIVCDSVDESLRALDVVMREKKFGAAGERVVVEERLTGEEASVFAITDGRDYVVLPAAQDHKRAFDGDAGANTGGMGAYAPAPVVTDDVLETTRRTIIEPVIQAMHEEGRPYHGVLYCGLMITTDGPKVIEFNCRFGDPECQVLMPLLQTDLVDVCMSVAERRLTTVTVSSSTDACACVVMASGGYPEAFEKGKPISGIDEAAGDQVTVFHAGTAVQEGRLVTSGGRVLAVTAVAPTLREAVSKAYSGVYKIRFDNMHYRNDIAHRALT